MGFLNWLFGPGPKKSLEILNQSSNALRLAVFTYLYNSYVGKYKKDEASLLAVAVLNTMILLPPGNEQAADYFRRNADGIMQMALLVQNDADLCGPSGGVSYLYAAEILYPTAMINNPELSQQDKEPYRTRIRDLEEQAAILGIWVPGTYDISNSNDPVQAIKAIHAFSQRFLKEHVKSTA